MKRYSFSLTRVLRVRSTQEELATQALRAAAERAARADDDYDLALRNYEAQVASEASLRGMALGVLACRDLDTLRARAVVDTELKRERAHDSAETAHAAWADARRRVSALERLDERQRAEYLREVVAAEDAEADDITTSRRRAAARRRPIASPADGGEPR